MFEAGNASTALQIVTGHAPWWSYDPLAEDDRDDGRVETTRRGLVRLAIAAARVGARFERDGVDVDPAAWLLAPRRMFDGECALESCLDLLPFRRCVMLHAPGVDAGMDADPEELDRVLEEEGQDEWSSAGSGPKGQPRNGRRRPQEQRPPRRGGWSGPRLFSCSMVRSEAGSRITTFVAGVAADERDFRRRLFDRYGAVVALAPGVRAGFDQFDPVAVSLLSERLADWLATVAAEPFRCGQEDFEVVVEHRTQA